jgi:hypothetical protein
MLPESALVTLSTNKNREVLASSTRSPDALYTTLSRDDSLQMLGYRLIDSLIAESSLPAHIEFLSIATVVKLWSAAPYLSERIRQIPAVQIIRSRTEFKKALKGPLDARSARLLTFPQFEAAFKSTTCMLCWISDGKATSLSLLHSHRLCQSCVDYHQDFLPLKVDLELYVGTLVRIWGLYAAMKLHWRSQDLIARRTIVVPVPMMREETSLR